MALAPLVPLVAVAALLLLPRLAAAALVPPVVVAVTLMLKLVVAVALMLKLVAAVALVPLLAPLLVAAVGHSLLLASMGAGVAHHCPLQIHFVWQPPFLPLDPFPILFLLPVPFRPPPQAGLLRSQWACAARCRLRHLAHVGARARATSRQPLPP